MPRKRRSSPGDIEIMARVQIGTDDRCDTGTTEALGVSNAQAIWSALRRAGFRVVEKVRR
jgi:hypothetical protein